jgi:hypothetical protein
MSLSYPSKEPSSNLGLVTTRPGFQHLVKLHRFFFIFSTIYFLGRETRSWLLIVPYDYHEFYQSSRTFRISNRSFSLLDSWPIATIYKRFFRSIISNINNPHVYLGGYWWWYGVNEERQEPMPNEPQAHICHFARATRTKDHKLDMSHSTNTPQFSKLEDQDGGWQGEVCTRPPYLVYTPHLLRSPSPSSCVSFCTRHVLFIRTSGIVDAEHTLLQWSNFNRLYH